MTTHHHWKDQLARSVTDLEELSEILGVDTGLLRPVISRYPMRITRHYLSLIHSPGDPQWLQAVPDPRELDGRDHLPDPLFEMRQSPVRSVIHRYPDRVIFLVSSQCAMICRHCMRKRLVGKPAGPETEPARSIDQGIAYIRRTKTIREVILSGGDPLLLETPVIDVILSELRSIPHIDHLRIHTRVPCTLPARITPALVEVLKKHQPLYMITHFNHPSELVAQSESALKQLADAGIPLGCQSVLLRGVNCDGNVMEKLMRSLVKNRVKPYYLHHPDPIRGTGHFRPSIDEGLSVMRALRGNVSGLCIPQYMIDLPGGLGKVPLLPDYIQAIDGNRAEVVNFQGRSCTYDFTG